MMLDHGILTDPDFAILGTSIETMSPLVLSTEQASIKVSANVFLLSYVVSHSLCCVFLFISLALDRVLRQSQTLKDCELKVSLAPSNTSLCTGGVSVDQQVHCPTCMYVCMYVCILSTRFP